MGESKMMKRKELKTMPKMARETEKVNVRTLPETGNVMRRILFGAQYPQIFTECYTHCVMFSPELQG